MLLSSATQKECCENVIVVTPRPTKLLATQKLNILVVFQKLFKPCLFQSSVTNNSKNVGSATLLEPLSHEQADDKLVCSNFVA